jgi:hypothetical protein
MPPWSIVTISFFESGGPEGTAGPVLLRGGCVTFAGRETDVAAGAVAGWR